MMPDTASYCSKSTFGDLLSWHLFENGTHPGGSPSTKGEVWEKSQFAFAVGTSVRNLEYWLANDHFPRSTRNIERVIFGNSSAFNAWRKDLREQFIKSTRKINKFTEREIQENEVLTSIIFRTPPRTADFTGRDFFLTAIGNSLKQRSEDTADNLLRCCVVHGMGGIGKSALATEYAYRSRAEYEGIWWCDAEEDEQLWANLARLGELLSPVIPSDQDNRAKAEQTIHLLQLRSRRWLLIFDNLERLEVISGLLPNSNVDLLITSRISNWPAWGTAIDIGLMSLNESVDYLNKVSGRGIYSGAAKLAIILDNLPLALSHAAITCKITNISFDDYSSRAERLIKNLPLSSEYPKSVFATFSLAISDIVIRVPSAERIMAIASHCGPEEIPLTVFEGLIDNTADETSALSALLECSLMRMASYNDGTNSLLVHRLVQCVGRTRARELDLTSWAIDALCKKLTYHSDKIDLNSPSNWPAYERLNPHIIAITEHSPKDFMAQDGRWVLLLKSAEYLNSCGASLKAEKLLRKILSIHRQSKKRNGYDHVLIIHNLARILNDNGQLQEALVLFDEASFILETYYSNYVDDRCSVYGEMAKAFISNGDISRAENLLMKAFDTIGLNSNISESVLANREASLFTVLMRIRVEQDRLGEALTISERILASRRALLDEMDRSIADALADVARIHQNLGQQAEARPLFDEALFIYNSVLGVDHPDTRKALARAAPFQIATMCSAGVGGF